MRRTIRAVLGGAVLLVATACYHATIETGQPAGTQTVTNEWAHGFLWGLVAPEIVSTASQCRNGVARVETQHSFLNMLASIVTFSLYTPMQIDVTCASASRVGALNGELKGTVVQARDASPAAMRDAIAQAADLSQRTSRAAYVVF